MWGGGAGAPRRDVEVPERRGGVGIKLAGDAGGARRSPAPTRVALKCGGSAAALRKAAAPGAAAASTGGRGEAAAELGSDRG